MPSLDDRLAEHWTVWELADHHYSPRRPPEGAELEAQRDLVVRVLEPLRVAWGRPLWCVSGYRTQWTNATVAGASKSQHMTGRAADITPVPLAVSERLRRGLYVPEPEWDLMQSFVRFVQHWVLRDPAEAVGGWGPYPGWVHLDTRPRGTGGHIAHWIGKGIGSEK